MKLEAFWVFTILVFISDRRMLSEGKALGADVVPTSVVAKSQGTLWWRIASRFEKEESTHRLELTVAEFEHFAVRKLSGIARGVDGEALQTEAKMLFDLYKQVFPDEVAGWSDLGSKQYEYFFHHIFPKILAKARAQMGDALESSSGSDSESLNGSTSTTSETTDTTGESSTSNFTADASSGSDGPANSLDSSLSGSATSSTSTTVTTATTSSVSGTASITDNDVPATDSETSSKPGITAEASSDSRTGTTTSADTLVAGASSPGTSEIETSAAPDSPGTGNTAVANSPSSGSATGISSAEDAPTSGLPVSDTSSIDTAAQGAYITGMSSSGTPSSGTPPPETSGSMTAQSEPSSTTTPATTAETEAASMTGPTSYDAPQATTTETEVAPASTETSSSASSAMPGASTSTTAATSEITGPSSVSGGAAASGTSSSAASTSAISTTGESTSSTSGSITSTLYTIKSTSSIIEVSSSLMFFSNVYDSSIASNIAGLDDNTNNIEAVVQSSNNPSTIISAATYTAPTILNGIDSSVSKRLKRFLSGSADWSASSGKSATASSTSVDVLFCDVAGNAIWKWSADDIPVVTSNTTTSTTTIEVLGDGLCSSTTTTLTVSAYQTGCSLQNHPEGCDDVYYKGCAGLTVSPNSDKIVVARTGGRTLGVLSYVENGGSCQGQVVDAISTYRGRKFNSPTYVEYSNKGILYFTDSPFGLATNSSDLDSDDLDNSPLREIPFNGVYMLRNGTGQSVELVDCDMSRPNKIAFSPGQDKMYITNSRSTDAYVKEYTLAEDGSANSSSIFFNFTAVPELDTRGGYPTGIKTDDSGNVYVVVNTGVYIFTPNATLVGSVISNQALDSVALGVGRMFLTGGFGVVAQTSGVEPSSAIAKAKTTCAMAASS